MFSWATERLEQLAQTVAPPPTDAVGRFLYAVQKNDESAAQGCLTEMIDPIYSVIQPTKGTYPIHLACQHGMERLMRQILTIPGASTEQLDAMGNTALHYACLNTNAKMALHMVKLLVTEFSASVVAKNGTGQTPYDTATVNSVRQYLLPLQLQQETQQALDNGGVGLPPGIDMGGLKIRYDHMPPPPIGNNAIPSTPTSGPPQFQFTTPSPGIPPVTSQMSVPPSMNIPPAPTSGTHNYARTGHSSAAIGAASRYRPDGFHSSSSDHNLAKKYGNANSGNAPAIPPPPSSGDNPLVSSSPYSALPTAASSGPNPYARGGIPKSRYLSYDGTAIPTPPTSATFNYYGAPSTTAAPTQTGFTMFNPAGGAPIPASLPSPATSYQQHLQPNYDQGHHQQPPPAQQGCDQAYQQPPQQQEYNQGYQQPPPQDPSHDQAYQQPAPEQAYDQGYHQPSAQQGYDPQANAYYSQQPAASPYQQPVSSAASMFLPPPPRSHVNYLTHSVEVAPTQLSVFISPYAARINLPGSLDATPSSNSASVFASPPSGGVPVLPEQQHMPYPSHSTEYSTPLKADPIAVFAAPPSGGMTPMPPKEPIMHSLSTGSIQSAHDLFSSGPVIDDVAPLEPTVDETEQCASPGDEPNGEQEEPKTASELFANQIEIPSVSENTTDAGPPSDTTTDQLLDASLSEPIASPDAADDSMVDMQDVPLSETPEHKMRTTPQSAATATTAQDLFG